MTPAWRDLYEVRAAQGDDVGAADAYRNAMGNKELDPLLRKALEFVGKGRLGAAEGICREYLKRRPHDVDAIRLLAEVGIALGSTGEAILLLERCLELAPSFHVARANYVTALARYQRFDEALKENQSYGESSRIIWRTRCSTLQRSRWQGDLNLLMSNLLRSLTASPTTSGYLLAMDTHCDTAEGVMRPLKFIGAQLNQSPPQGKPTGV